MTSKLPLVVMIRNGQALFVAIRATKALPRESEARLRPSSPKSLAAMLDCDWICLGNLSKWGAEAPFSFEDYCLDAGRRELKGDSDTSRLDRRFSICCSFGGENREQAVPSLRQPRPSQAFRGYREVLRLNQQPVIERAGMTTAGYRSSDLTRSARSSRPRPCRHGPQGL